MKLQFNRDTERACSRAAGATFRGAQVEPGGSETHERRPTGHDAMCAASPDHTYHLFIYVYLIGLLLELSLLHAQRVVNNRLTGPRDPRGPACARSPGHRRTNRAGIDRKIHHLRAPQSRRTVTWYPIRLRMIPGCASAQVYANARALGDQPDYEFREFNNRSILNNRDCLTEGYCYAISQLHPFRLM